MEKKEALKNDAPFRYRSYGKGELASLYMPAILPGSARKVFNEWIDFHPQLRQMLVDTGLVPRTKRYTPAQVRLIVAVLGEP